MSKRVVITIGIVAGLFMVLCVGTAVGAGFIYFLTQSPAPVFAFQDNEQDPNEGLIVVSVDPGSPAEEAGIVRGDILFEIEDQAVDNLSEVVDALSDFREGDEVQVTVLHGDEVRRYSLTLETDYFPVALGIRLCCGSDEPLGPGRFLDPVQKPMIIEVIPDSPAEDSGLQVGDIILAINGDEIEANESLADIIATFEVGDEVVLQIQGRGGRETTEIEVTLDEHPDREGRAYLGVRFAPNFRARIISGDEMIPLPDLDGHEFDFELPPFRRHFEFPFLDPDRFDFYFPHFNKDLAPYFFKGEMLSGIVIGEVLEDSPAANAGLLSGDVILGINGDPISTPESFRDAIADQSPGEIILLAILHQDEKIDVEVLLGEHPDLPGAGYLGISIGGFIHLGGKDIENYPHDFWHFFQFDGIPFMPHHEIPEPEAENQST